MTKHTVFIDGSEGTTGLQIYERFASRDDIEVIKIDPALRKEDAARKECLNSADLVILCLPDEASRQAVAMIENPKVRIIDASTAYRTDAKWVYGFPELSKQQSSAIRVARFVSNPGCYATAAIALLAPLVRKKVLSSQNLYSIMGISGYSGAGRKTIDLCEGRTEETPPSGFQLYSLGATHKHVPEIMTHAGLTREPVFSPSIDNRVRQGMLVSIPVDLSTVRSNGHAMSSADRIHSTLAMHYIGQESVQVMPFDKQSYPGNKLALDGVSGKDHMELYVIPYENSGAVVLIARLDNLGKGASGAAVQNMNLMFG